MPYEHYNPNPKNKHTGDCVVRAISKVLNLNWDDTYMLLSAKGFTEKAVLTDDNVWGKFLSDRGFVMRPLLDTCPNCYTVSAFSEDHPLGSYIVKTPGHVLAIVNGVYYDTTDSGGEVPIYYWAKGEK